MAGENVAAMVNRAQYVEINDECKDEIVLQPRKKKIILKTRNQII